jgi:hypothetical protein
MRKRRKLAQRSQIEHSEYEVEDQSAKRVTILDTSTYDSFPHFLFISLVIPLVKEQRQLSV